MKKLILFLGLILCSLVAVAQQMQPLPIDPKVRYGKLENGLTYYIRHNELPKQRADFYLANDVGAILEDDDQNGLAHVLEHVAFYGSKHFPGNSIFSYLETIGIKFGENLNAGTGVNETVYNISNVPVIREGIIDSCLLILHDWSGFLLLEDEKIEQERAVVREEQRTRLVAGRRATQDRWSQIVPNSQYANRFVIGTPEIIENFKPERLRDFYRKWYRPDLQAVIVVGDIDVDQIENKIKTLFSDHLAQTNPAERVRYQVNDNDEPVVGIASDTELQFTAFFVDYKHKPIPKELKGTMAHLMMDYFNSMISKIMAERLTEISERANPPFIFAQVSKGLFATTDTEESLFGFSVIKENEFEAGVKGIIREMERVRKYGFNASEYERAKANLLTEFENAFQEKDKKENSHYTEKYVKHFTQGGYIPGIEMENMIISSAAPQIPLEALNQYAQGLIRDKNVVLSMIALEKEGIAIPTKELLLKWYEETKNEDIQPLQETASDEPLMAELPSGGTIKKVTRDEKFGTTVLELSNGVKAIIKTTDFKDNEILMAATSPGGSSHFPDSEATNIKMYHVVSTLGGLGQFSATDLTKALAGKRVSVNPTISVTDEGFTGSSSIKDFETMLQLIYLNFTAPRMDDDAFQSTISRVRSISESQEAAPEIAMIDSITKESYVRTVTKERIRPKDLEKVNYQTIMNWRKDRYADASDFTFVFTGNINPDESKDLIAKYLGSLPSINRKESFVKVNENLRPGINKNTFEQKMENPKAIVYNIYWSIIEPSLKNRIEIDMLTQILEIVYQEKIREDEGGTYGVRMSSGIEHYPKGQTPVLIMFETESEKAEYLNGIVHAEFRNLAKDGPRQEDFDKVKEFMLRKRQEQERENSFWSATIIDFYRSNYDGYNDYRKILNDVTPAEIRKKAQHILDSKNLIEVVMKGVK